MTNNRKIKFIGFHRDENGKEKIFVNVEWVKGYWVYGVPASSYMITTVKAVEYQKNAEFAYVSFDYATIIPETVGQYTGLKDKNGKEIYEGDILKTDKFIGVIEYNDIVAAFVVKINDSTDNYYHWSFLNEGDITRNSQLQYTEKIGNIYENPELLEVK